MYTSAQRTGENSESQTSLTHRSGEWGIVINVRHLFSVDSDIKIYGDPHISAGKESACQRRRLKRYGFHLWVEKIPSSWKRQHTPVFLPRIFHGKSNLVGYSPRGGKELDMTEHVHLHADIKVREEIYTCFSIKSKKTTKKSCPCKSIKVIWK